MQLYRFGDRGAAVADVQSTLAGLGLLRAPDQPVFDEATDRALRDFQQRRGLSVDGVVGAETYRALTAARFQLGDRLLSLATRRFVGDDVLALQERLLELGFDAGRADGVFGPRTASALASLQREYGLVSDGTCGPATLRALRQLGRKVTGGRPTVMREAEALHRSGAALPGKVIVLDPGHGGRDRGATGHGLEEAAIVEDLAARLEGRLTALGVRALLTRGTDRSPSDAARAEFANDAGADLVLSLHVDRGATPHAQGVACYHFGAGRGTTSTVGEHFASLVQREVVARTDLLDCRVHEKTWESLRLTRMPAVRLELGHLTHPRGCRATGRPGVSRHRRRGGARGRAATVPAARPRPTDRGHADAGSGRALMDDVRVELAAYDPVEPGQVTLREQFLARLDGPSPTSREGAPDHLTASAIVLSHSLEQVLLVLHRKVGLWMQPGGHVDAEDCCLSEAAVREAVEETGVEGLTLASRVPVHLERHRAPCGAEHHLDVRFLLRASETAPATVSEESLDVAWWPVDGCPSWRSPGWTSWFRPVSRRRSSRSEVRVQEPGVRRTRKCGPTPWTMNSVDATANPWAT